MPPVWRAPAWFPMPAGLPLLPREHPDLFHHSLMRKVKELGRALEEGA